VKTWRLKNSGSCTWNSNYKLVFDSGAVMEGASAVSFTGNVSPGQTVDLSVTLKAPATPGSYQGFWKLQNASGARFGIGATASVAFWVKITVAGTTTPSVTATSNFFAVTSVNGSVSPANIQTTCDASNPFRFTFSAAITTSTAGTVTYRWERSDGAVGPTQSLEFSSAGTQTVTTTWDLGADYSGWQRVYIDNPNHQAFNQINFTLDCLP
jgi:hypothetical protein